MKHLLKYKLFESQEPFQVNDIVKKKLITWIEKKMINQDINLVSWVYNNIVRGKQSDVDPKIETWIKGINSKWQSFLTSYLDKYKSSDIMETGQDDQSEWFGITYNKKLKTKEVKDGKELTKNYYVSFEKTEENLQKWFNSFASLISDFYKASTEGELKNSSVALKCGFRADHFLFDNDHLKFYWYKDEDKSKVVDIVQKWLNKNGIKTQKRAYDFGVDTAQGKDKSSFGIKVSETVCNQLDNLIKTHGNKYSAEQYANYLIKMLNTTKFNF